MSDTPRVDALIETLDKNHEVAVSFVWRQMVNLARTLERELRQETEPHAVITDEGEVDRI